MSKSESGICMILTRYIGTSTMASGDRTRRSETYIRNMLNQCNDQRTKATPRATLWTFVSLDQSRDSDLRLEHLM